MIQQAARQAAFLLSWTLLKVYDCLLFLTV